SLLALILAASHVWRWIRRTELARYEQALEPDEDLTDTTEAPTDNRPGKQRRTSFRVRVPRKQPATVTILDQASPAFNVSLPLYDISTGGLRLIDQNDSLGDLAGQSLHG